MPVERKSGNFVCGCQHHAAARSNPDYALTAERRRAQRGPGIAAILGVKKSISQSAGAGGEALPGGTNRAVGGEAGARDQSIACGIGGIVGKTRNRERRLLVGQRRPARAAVGRLPDAAPRLPTNNVLAFRGSAT